MKTPGSFFPVFSYGNTAPIPSIFPEHPRFIRIIQQPRVICPAHPGAKNNAGGIHPSKLF
ncbi:MAG: hypothetical protein MR763_12695 [Clostridiales bacterium]|nr:hypothetical protein [Clostridiales bacterium]